MPELKGKNFSMKDYLKNEDKNYHTENAVELVNLYGTAKEKKEIKAIHDRQETSGFLGYTDYQSSHKLHNKYYQRFSDEQSKKSISGLQKTKSKSMEFSLKDQRYRDQLSDLLFEQMNARKMGKKYEKYDPDAKKIKLNKADYSIQKLKNAYKNLPEITGEDRKKLTKVLDGYDTKSLTRIADAKIPSVSSSAKIILWQRNSLKLLDKNFRTELKKSKPELSKGSYMKENRPNLNGRTTGSLSADKKKQKGSLSVDKRMWL